MNEEEKSNDIIFPAIKSDIQKVITASGILQAKEEVEIGSQASGQVKQILVKEGQRVKKGDLLVLIDPRIAETELKLAKAELDMAEANLEIKKRLLQKEIWKSSEISETLKRQSYVSHRVV
nr:biotin/lipoyl-binding protein [Pasteurella multocida]